ncbi:MULTISPECIES: YchJ family protein [unclassified Knoellia]|uniref:YchJ family protein n=1 Tax=Knoellia altitudinis TaxID=3404795 RepID=UPI003623FA7C
MPDGADLSACCGPFLSGETWPPTPVTVMRSRYTAYAMGDSDHLFRTWHPATRPAEVDLDQALEWVGLEIIEVSGDDDTGVVEFAAHWRSGQGPSRQDGAVRERSTFVRRAGRWFYRDGVDTRPARG